MWYTTIRRGDEHGPTLCFRGLETTSTTFWAATRRPMQLYRRRQYPEGDHSVVKRLILDSLRYWVSEMHVDGFRFDLASIFSRSESGQPVLNAPIVWEIDSILCSPVQLIAEAWDSGGLYQVVASDKTSGKNGTVSIVTMCAASSRAMQIRHGRSTSASLAARTYTRQAAPPARALTSSPATTDSPERPRLLQLEAQREQPKRKSRRNRQQRQLELWRRRLPPISM